MEFTDLIVVARNLYRFKKQKDQHKYEDEFFKLLFEQLHNKILYIDSNIFMAQSNVGVERFFNEIQEYPNIYITMPTEQYEEIYNLKNSDIEVKAKPARNAFRIIEKLFDSKHLNIRELKDEPNKVKAYADPVFIKMITENLKEQKKVYFITEDKDLKIRLKSKVESEKLNIENLVICSFETLYEDKENLVDEERNRKKDIKKGEEFLDELANGGSLKDKALDKIAAYISK